MPNMAGGKKIMKKLLALGIIAGTALTACGQKTAVEPVEEKLEIES
jgi:Fe2+ transport system protein FeoA